MEFVMSDFEKWPTKEILREKILNRLETKDILNLRLTCKFFKNLIDEEDGLDICLKDRYSKKTRKRLDLYCKVALRCLLAHDISVYENPGDGPAKYGSYKLRFDQIFRYPSALKSVWFNGSTNLLFVYDLITKCVNLQHIYFCSKITGGCLLQKFLVASAEVKGKKTRLDIVNAFTQDESEFLQVSMPKLESIEGYFTQHRKDPDSNIITALTIMKVVRSCSLKKATFNLLIPLDSSYVEFVDTSLVLGDFVDYHAATLKKLYFSVRFTSNNINRMHSDIKNFPKLVKYLDEIMQGKTPEDARCAPENPLMLNLCENLKKTAEILKTAALKSNLSYLFLELYHIVNWDIWCHFMRHLQTLVAVHLAVSTQFGPLSCEIFQNSFASLKIIRVQTDLFSPIDMSGLEECQKLEEVCVLNSLKESDQSIFPEYFMPNVINVKDIPPGLKHLALINVVVGTRDLWKTFEKQKLLNTLIVINKMSTNEQTGTDYICLLQIGRMRNLESCLIQGIRCKTWSIYEKAKQLVHFQTTEEDKEVLDEWMSEEEWTAEMMTPVIVEICSKEAYCPYEWVRGAPGGQHSYNYFIKFTNNTDMFQ